VTKATFDFSNYAALEQRLEPRPLIIDAPGFKRPVKLMLLPATDINPDYHNDWVRRITERRTNKDQATTVDGKLVERARTEDRELIGLHCVADWPEPPVDATGKDVPFSREAAEAFMLALPGYVFDDVRVFCASPANFVTITDAAKEKAGN
jgi:hypothetical protein